MQNSDSGVIEMRAGVGGIEIKDECNISPLPLDSLYTNVSSFTKSRFNKTGIEQLTSNAEYTVPDVMYVLFEFI